MDKKVFIVKTPVEHDGERFEKDDEIELDDGHATPLLECGAIEDPDEVKKTAKPARAPKKVERKPAAKK